MSLLLRKVLLGGALFGAGKLAKASLDAAYERKTGRAPPKNPAAKDVDWTTALLWSGTIGLVAGMTRATVRRVAAEANDGKPVDDRR